MMQHWRPQPSIPCPPVDERPPARIGRFDLEFRRHGEATCIGRQFVSYPYHFTRPFALDMPIPSLLTVYQQSSSGGLYRADALSSRLDLAPLAAAHVTTQAATVVHDCHGAAAALKVEIDAGPGSFLAHTPDPLILFPGASVSSAISVRLGDGAVVLLQDAFATHDPRAGDGVFDQLRSEIAVTDAGGGALVLDRQHVEGRALRSNASPIGSWQVVVAFLLLGAAARLPSLAALRGVETTDRAVVGISALPNGAGWCIRCLAADAVAARHVCDGVFNATVLAAFGTCPAPRRK